MHDLNLPSTCNIYGTIYNVHLWSCAAFYNIGVNCDDSDRRSYALSIKLHVVPIELKILYFVCHAPYDAFRPSLVNYSIHECIDREKNQANDCLNRRWEWHVTHGHDIQKGDNKPRQEVRANDAAQSYITALYSVRILHKI